MEVSSRQITALIAEIKELKALVMHLVDQQPTTHSATAREEIAIIKARGGSVAEHLKAKAQASNAESRIARSQKNKKERQPANEHKEAQP